MKFISSTLKTTAASGLDIQNDFFSKETSLADLLDDAYEKEKEQSESPNTGE
jgi:hypothetical protein